MAGRLEVICGCMFSGKTARLIALLEDARRAERRVAAFKHQLDARYDACHLATHDGRRFDALAVDDATDILERGAETDVVAVDEAQFFGRPLIGVCEALRTRGQRVIIVGIDHDAWGQEFTPLPQLKAIADAVDVLHVPCTVCGQPACFSQRVVPITRPDMVGGPAEYEPRCAACFRPLPPPAPRY